MLRSMCTVAIELSLICPAAAVTVQVSPGMSIQEVLDSGSVPLVVLLEPGVYTENLAYPLGRSIQIRSTSSRFDTQIRGQIAFGGEALQTLEGVAVRPNEPAYMGGLTTPAGLESTYIVRGCSISGFSQSALRTYGGLDAFLIEDCVFSDNFADDRRRATLAVSGSGDGHLTVRNTVFVGNRSLDVGGACYVDGTSPVTFEGCLFVGNTAVHGGAVFVEPDATVTFTNCTLVENHAYAGFGGGVFSYLAQLEVVNSIITNNHDWEGVTAGSQVTSLPESLLTMSYSAVPGWSDAGIGMVDSQVEFIDDSGPDGVPGTGDEDLRLAPNSVCVDAGNASALSASFVCDLSRRARIRGTTVDLGAFEHQPTSCPGDLNCDLAVDFADLNQLLSGWGTESPSADADQSGFVDFSDLNLLLANWNAVCD